MSGPVETLYRDYPYPGHGVVSSVVARMLAPSVARVRSRRPGVRLRVLDAGCGTGEQALGIAREFPDVEVTGVDFSEASLQMAQRLARRHHLEVRFERRDLTQPLNDLGQFDLVVSVGVLHHLPQPPQGFARLREVCTPKGAFLGMVYGKFGKWPTFQLRDALRMLGGAANRAELLQLLGEGGLANNRGPFHYLETLSRRLRFGPSIAPVEALRRTVAGRSNAYQADTFTHVQEAAYSWAELAQTLTDTGWSFDGWPKSSGMPDDPAQLLRGKAVDAARQLSQLDQAAVYERILRPVCLYFLASPQGSAGAS
jgi:SAM-dependent methyltransferase